MCAMGILITLFELVMVFTDQSQIKFRNSSEQYNIDRNVAKLTDGFSAWLCFASDIRELSSVTIY